MFKMIINFFRRKTNKKLKIITEIKSKITELENMIIEVKELYINLNITEKDKNSLGKLILDKERDKLLTELKNEVLKYSKDSMLKKVNLDFLNELEARVNKFVFKQYEWITAFLNDTTKGLKQIKKK